MGRRGDSRDLGRRSPSRDPLPRILVVCEGAVTERQYLNGFRVAQGANTVQVKVETPGGDPKALVDRAIELRDEAEREAKRARDRNLRFNEVWCVFDVDQHQRLDEALREAGRSTIALAVSEPCFELWLLLHFGDHTAYLTPKEARDHLRKHLPGYDKHLHYSDVAGGYPDAVRRATVLDKRRDEPGGSGGNPSTGVHRLTERILKLGKNQRLARTPAR